MPINLGFTVLELSKVLMNEVYYELPNLFWKKIQLHCLDTDSFVLSFDTNDEGSIDF